MTTENHLSGTPEPTGLIRELIGTSCRCGATKKTRQTFCRSCYFSLSRPMQLALYREIGAGYEQAYMNAAIVLETKRQGKSEA